MHARLSARLHPRQRKAVLLAALALVVIGLGWSLSELDLRWSSLSFAPLLLSILVVSPLMLAMNALGLQLSAVVLDRRIGFVPAVGTSAAGTIAELLPIPGGLMARGAALLGSGASIRDSGLVLTAGSVLWLGLAAAGTGIAIATRHAALANTMIVGGAVASAVALAWVVSRGGWQAAVLMLMHRCITLAVLVVRIWLAFTVLGVSVALRDTSVFAMAAIVGNSVAIVPAGLGVTESIAAALAPLVTIAPAAAFTAMALNRAVGLAVAGVVAAWLARRAAAGAAIDSRSDLG